MGWFQGSDDKGNREDVIQHESRIYKGKHTGAELRQAE